MRYAIAAVMSFGLLAGCQGQGPVSGLETDTAIGTGAGALLGATAGDGVLSTLGGAAAGYGAAEVVDETYQEEAGPDAGIFE